MPEACIERAPTLDIGKPDGDQFGIAVRALALSQEHEVAVAPDFVETFFDDLFLDFAPRIVFLTYLAFALGPVDCVIVLMSPHPSAIHQSHCLRACAKLLIGHAAQVFGKAFFIATLDQFAAKLFARTGPDVESSVHFFPPSMT